MMDWFMSGGVIMWPLLILALGVIGLAAREALLLQRADNRPRPATTAGAILFWGGVALLVGALGAVVGIVIMARNVAVAGEVSSTLAWSGVGMSLVPLVFGIVIFLVAALLWLPLNSWGQSAS